VKLDGDGNFGGWATQLGGATAGAGNSQGIAWDATSNTVFATGLFSGSLGACSADSCSGPVLNTSNRDGANVFVVQLDATTGLPPVLSPLMAAAPAMGDVPEAQLFSQESLDRVVSQAIGYWADHGLSAVQLHELSRLHVRVANFSGNTLGQASASSGYVRIDQDAAGFGWSSEGRGGMDLLSVLTHEVGHVLGFEHGDEEHDVMAPTLSVGASRIGPLSGDSSALPDPLVAGRSTAVNSWATQLSPPTRPRALDDSLMENACAIGLAACEILQPAAAEVWGTSRRGESPARMLEDEEETLEHWSGTTLDESLLGLLAAEPGRY
jgi:hypothetical protein